MACGVFACVCQATPWKLLAEAEVYTLATSWATKVYGLDVGFVGCMGFTRSGMPETCSDGSQSGAVSRALLVQMHGAPILTILSGPRTIRLEFQQRAGRPNTWKLHW